jgi:hypothetical protein
MRLHRLVSESSWFRVLRIDAESHFHFADVPWGNYVDTQVVPASGAIPLHLEQSFFGDHPRSFDLVAKFAPTEADLAEYTGAYVSEEIDVIYRTLIQDGSLSLMRLNQRAADTLTIVCLADSRSTAIARFEHSLDLHAPFGALA